MMKVFFFRALVLDLAKDVAKEIMRGKRVS